jgi:hypothetical protein
MEEQIKVFYPSKNTKKWKKFVGHPLFHQVLLFLHKEPENTVILRRLKEKFPHEQLEKFLDEGIELEVIERKDRRYNLLVPILDDSVSLDRHSELVEGFKKEFYELFTLSKEELTVILYKVLQKVFSSEFSEPLFFFGNSEIYHLFAKTPVVKELSEEKSSIKFRFFDTLAGEENNLPNYFSRIDKEEPLTDEENQLYQVIGDVNPEYVLHAFGIHLLKFAKREQIKSKRKDIFIDALVQLDYILPIDEVSYRQNVPVIVKESEKEFQQIEILTKYLLNLRENFQNELEWRIFAFEIMTLFKEKYKKQFIEVEV